MNKPITIERQEVLQKLVDIVNSAQLPAFVVVDMLEDILQSMRTVARQQYERDLKTYTAAVDGQEGAE